MDSEKILLGSSIELYEVEEDQDLDLAEKASIEYDAVSIIQGIGSDDFKSLYMVLMPHIREQSIELQKRFCYELLDKIEQVYGYIFPVNLDFTGNQSILDFYKFLEFLEFDYLDFLAKLWKLLPVELKTVNISAYCNSEAKLIIEKVDRVVDIEDLPKLVSIFARTYSKEGLIKFIVEKTEKGRMLIFLKIQEGGENG